MWVKNKNRQFCLFKWKYVQQTTRAKNHVEINNLIKLLNDVGIIYFTLRHWKCNRYNILLLKRITQRDFNSDVFLYA